MGTSVDLSVLCKFVSSPQHKALVLCGVLVLPWFSLVFTVKRVPEHVSAILPAPAMPASIRISADPCFRYLFRNTVHA